MPDIIQGLDFRYSAYGEINGRKFIAETLNDVQTYRQDLKADIEREELLAMVPPLAPEV